MFCFLALLLIFCVIFADVFIMFFVLLMCLFSVQSTALHGAANYVHPAVCELLIASKADMDAKDECAFIF